jgi:hypothetical protein
MRRSTLFVDVVKQFPSHRRLLRAHTARRVNLQSTTAVRERTLNFALAIMLVFAIALGYLVSKTLEVSTIVAILRVSALVSAVVFVFGFLLTRRSEAAVVRTANKVLTLTHGFHLGAIVAYYEVNADAVLDVLTVVVGGAAYLIIFAFGFVPTKGLTVIRLGWFVWFVFSATYAQNAAARPLTSGAGLLALVMVAGVRAARTRMESVDRALRVEVTS